MKLFTGLLLAVFLLLGSAFDVRAAGCGGGLGSRIFNGRIVNAFRAVFRPAKVSNCGSARVAADCAACNKVVLKSTKASGCAECALAEAAIRETPVSPPAIPLIVKPKGDPSAPLPSFTFKPK